MEPRDLLTNVSDNIRSISIGHASSQSHLINRIVSELLEFENATPDRSANEFPIGKRSLFRALHLSAKNSVFLPR